MKMIDLELYRWKWFNSIFSKSKSATMKQYSSLPVYWKELGAFVSTLPRQSGKTTMLSILIKEFGEKKEDYILVVAKENMKSVIVSSFSIPSDKIVVVDNNADKFMYYLGYYKIMYNNCNLLIDEYELIDHNSLISVLECNWKTVTMVGTLR